MKITGADGVMRYDANLEHHHHLVCDKCGRIIDVAISDALSKKLKPIDFHGGGGGGNISGWKLSQVMLEFKGTCPDCAGRK